MNVTTVAGGVLTNPGTAGQLTSGTLPSIFPIGNPPSLDSRQFQLGFKFNF